MRRIIPFCLALLALGGGLALAATAQKPAGKKSHSRHASAKSSGTRTSSKRASSKKSGTGKAPAKSASSKTGAKSKKPVRSAARRSRQSAPTPERYKEIQEALAQRGYYHGEPNGAWGGDSVEALKKFQQEQKLAPSGKLDSVSLIALGLGPKRNLAAAAAPDPNTQPRPLEDDHRSPQGSQRP